MSGVVKTTRRTLLVRLKDRTDQEAWQEFYGLYAPLLFHFARARGLSVEDAEEVRDQCLAALVGKMDSFEYDPRRGRFKAWLYRIVAGKVADLSRRRARTPAGEDALAAVADDRPTPEEQWERRWRQELLRFCLERVRDRVPRQPYEVFRLLVFEGVSVAEVGRRLGWNANQVYKAKSRVLARLRALYRAVDEGAGISPPPRDDPR